MFDAHLVCKLLKSLYKLKQAPRIWYETLNKALNVMSLQRLESDHSVFGKMQGRRVYDIIYVGPILIILVHVDDTLIVGFPEAIKTFKQALK
jgi:Reverse transcriptase (RNA-dependent DNA polymerase)